MLLLIQKNVFPAHQRSNVVYKYSYHCGSVSIGRNIIEKRIEQHVSRLIRKQVKSEKDQPRCQCKFTQKAPISDYLVRLLVNIF